MAGSDKLEMDNWNLDKVEDFMTAEFGSEIAQKFKGKPSTLPFRLAFNYATHFAVCTLSDLSFPHHL